MCFRWCSRSIGLPCRECGPTGSGGHGRCGTGCGSDAELEEHGGGAAGGVQFVTEVHELANERHCLLLVFVLERDEDVALARDLVARCQLAAFGLHAV